MMMFACFALWVWVGSGNIMSALTSYLTTLGGRYQQLLTDTFGEAASASAAAASDDAQAQAQAQAHSQRQWVLRVCNEWELVLRQCLALLTQFADTRVGVNWDKTLIEAVMGRSYPSRHHVTHTHTRHTQQLNIKLYSVCGGVGRACIVHRFCDAPLGSGVGVQPDPFGAAEQLFELAAVDGDRHSAVAPDVGQ
jgi:hypothetical protein